MFLCSVLSALCEGRYRGRNHRGAVTTRTRLCARAVECAGAVRVGIIVRRDVRTKMRLGQLVVLAVASWMLVVVTHCAFSQSDAPPVHGPHATVSAAASEFAGFVGHLHYDVDHPHLADSSITYAHEGLAAAVLPRVTKLGIALGLVSALAVALSVGAGTGAMLVRGPPGGPSVPLSGQQRLTRLCITRR